MPEKRDESAAAIAGWLGTEFQSGTLEYRRLDSDYQVGGYGVSTWKLEEDKDVFLYRVREGAAKYELAVTVFALEDHPIERIMGQLHARRVVEMLRRNPDQRVWLDKTLVPTVRPRPD